MAARPRVLGAVLAALACLATGLLVRPGLVRVRGRSMEPLLRDGDLLVTVAAPRFATLRRAVLTVGTICVADLPVPVAGGAEGGAAEVGADGSPPAVRVVKQVHARPGELVGGDPAAAGTRPGPPAPAARLASGGGRRLGGDEYLIGGPDARTDVPVLDGGLLVVPGDMILRRAVVRVPA